MAKNYQDIYNSAYVTGNKMDFTNTMIRGNGIPLDIYSVFDSFNKAVIFAATNAVAYEGQTIAVTENGDTILYVISPKSQGKVTITDGETSTEYDNYLKEVGTVPVGDGLSIEVEDGVIKLVGFGENYTDKDGHSVAFSAGLQLTTVQDGDKIKLAWMKPDTSTADGAAAAVEALEKRVESVESGVSTNATGISGINTKIGTVPEGKDVVTMISDAQTAATYDDTKLSGRVKTIEDDYLKTSDKTTLANSIKKNTDAITKLNGDEKIVGSVKNTVTAEIAKIVAEAPEDFDTLKEIADWIANDQTGAASLTNRIASIEDTYLTEKEINDLISEIEVYIGTIPETSASENVIAYIQEVVKALKIGDYAKASDLTAHINNTTAHITAEERSTWNAKAEVSTTLEGYGITDAYTKTETDGEIDSKVNVVDGKVTTLSGTVDTHTKDTVSHITADERKAWNSKLDAQTTLEGYGITNAYNKTETDSAINTKVGEVNSSVSILSTTVTEHIENDTRHLTEDEKTYIERLPAALAKKVAGVKIVGTELTADEDGNVNIPVSTTEAYGVVKSSTAEGKVSVGTDGIMTVNSLNVNNLVQTDGDILILDCGVIE